MIEQIDYVLRILDSSGHYFLNTIKLNPQNITNFSGLNNNQLTKLGLNLGLLLNHQINSLKQYQDLQNSMIRLLSHKTNNNNVYSEKNFSIYLHLEISIILKNLLKIIIKLIIKLKQFNPQYENHAIDELVNYNLLNPILLEFYNISDDFLNNELNQLFYK